MSLVECRFNPNHKMKLSKREIHEQKCPDRFNCKKKLKYCPYNPLELIEEKDYEAHLLKCKNRPNITLEQEEQIERAKKLNDIATEQEKIQYARLKYYKDCVEEPEVLGLGNIKQQKKKKRKKLREKFAELNKQDADRLAAIAGHENENDDDNEKHEIEDFPADQNFDLGNEEEEEEKNRKNFEKNKKEEKKEDKNSKKEKKEDKNSDKEKKEDKNTKQEKKDDKNTNKQKYFSKYNPNEEDKNITKYSANILIPEHIYMILREK